MRAASRPVEPYVELRAHTAFSFGGGATTPEALVARAAELGYASLGLTDTADLGGAVRFALETRRQGLRPVVGAELDVDGHPAAFLARTAEGYRNLAALVTRARSGCLDDGDGGGHAARLGAGPAVSPIARSRRGVRPPRPPSSAATRKAGPDRDRPECDRPIRGRPRVAWRDVVERSAGLHALTGPASGPLATLLRSGRPEDAARTLVEWRDVFDDAHLAVEVQLHHAGRAEEALAGALVELAERERVPWVVTNEPRYVGRAGRLAHDVLTALRAGLTLEAAAERGVLLPNGGRRLTSPREMATRWVGREAGLEESARIAAQCDFSLAWVRPPLPRFAVPAGHTDDSYLRERVYAGARERWGEVGEVERRQLEHELGIIRRLGFAGFFLIMWDAVREAHARGILCQGRGSAANSAVAYSLGITAVDPVRHGLLFERFLSEGRVDGQTEAPDIDVDVEHDRREEVLDYVYGRYRRGCAAITCVVQTYHAPHAVQDVMRAFGHPAELAATLSKRLHDLEPAAGAALLAQGLAAEFGLDVTGPKGRALLEAIAAFEGLPRLRSTHPGGFVLSSAPLGDHCPIEPTTMGRTIVQFDKDDLDAVGIPKFDFLGLGALSMVRRAFDAIELRSGVRPCIYRLPADDPAAFAMVARGDTMGMFQIESRAQISSLVHTRPERLYDLVVQVALIRPGPIQARFVHPYTRRRRGQERVAYLHPALEPILGRTYGIPIFQEQAMAIAMELAGYTAAEADELRRAMGNDRKAAWLFAALDRLRRRMIERGVGAGVAERIADDLRGFANYGFPESHAWSFALIAYATAWLKAHHPAAFYAGLLNAWPMGFYSPASLVHDAQRHGVKVRTPCLRAGEAFCTLEDTDDPEPVVAAQTRGAMGMAATSGRPAGRTGRPALRIGWRHVRGIGERTLERLSAEKAEAPFTSICDVVRRARLSRREAAALARARAFEFWQPDRRRAAWEALRVAGDTLPLAPAHRDQDESGPDEHGNGRYEPRPLGRHDVVTLDYNTMGLSTVGHPMERRRSWCRRKGILDSAELAGCRDGQQVTVAGLVTVRQRPQSANGTVFLLLEDEHGVVNVIVSRPLVEANREAVRHATFLAVRGCVERDGPLVQVIGRTFEPIDGADLVHRSHDFS